MSRPLTPKEAQYLARIKAGKRPAPLHRQAYHAGKALLGPKLKKEAADIRLNVCDPCEHNDKNGDEWYCKICRCARTGLAELHNKAYMAHAICYASNWPKVEKKDIDNGGHTTISSGSGNCC